MNNFNLSKPAFARTPQHIKDAAVLIYKYSGCTQKVIAEIIGVDASTFNTWVKPRDKFSKNRKKTSIHNAEANYYEGVNYSFNDLYLINEFLKSRKITSDKK